MRKNRENVTGASKRVRTFPIKLIITTVIIFLAIWFLIGYIWKIMKSSDYFKIKDIITRDANTFDFSYLKGKNIFDIDLKSESRYILESYPDYSKIKLVRLLPNHIFVDLVKRKPVAFVKLYRYFALDEEGMLFYTKDQPEELKLPVILGLETKIFGPKSGKKYDTKELLVALDIIKEVKRNRILKKYEIKRIDVANVANASIFIPFSSKTPGGLEVRLGPDNIKDKITILASLIIQQRKDLTNIKYIDLRFKEPVIKLNDAQSK